MFASMWLTKISYVCKPCNIIPFIFVGVMAMRVAGNEEGNGEGGKCNGDSNKWAKKRASATRVLAATTRWRATKRTMARAARMMATGMRMAGKQRGQWQWQQQQHG